MNTKTIDPSILNIFGQLLNQTHDVFVVFDMDWNFVFANRKACDYFGDGQDLAGRNLMSALPVYKDSTLIENMSKSRETRKPTEFEALSPFSKRWMHFRVYPLDGWLAIYAIDIHLRKEAQRTIQQNQERYFNFISQSSEGIWRYELEEPIDTKLPPDEQIDLVYERAYLAECNDAMAKMYGFRDAYDLMGSRLEMLLSKNEDNLAYLQAFIASGYRLSDAESVETAKDGSTKYMLNNLIGIIENGMVVRAWGTQRDITQIKEVEEKFRAAQEQVKLALAAGAAETFSWDIVNDEVEWGMKVHPDDLPRAKEAVKNSTSIDLELRMIAPDERVHRIWVRGKVMYSADGKPERVIGIQVDITGRNSL